LAGAAAARREALGLATTPLARDILENKLAAARGQLGEPAASVAWAAGKAMGQSQSVAFAISGAQLAAA
jgi:hypothetical protein